MKFIFQNKSGETYPAYGCGRLESVLSTDDATGNKVFELVKPDGQDGIYVINGPNNIIDDDFGVAFSLDEAKLVLIDDGSTATAPTFGQTCGPTNARWAITTSGTGLKASGEIANRLMPVLPLSSAQDSDSVSTERCPCNCIPAGDVLVNGIETTMLWVIKMGSETFNQEFGSINFPAGNYTVEKDPVEDEWTLDIGDFLTAQYESGADATEDTTLSGTLTMGFDAYGGLQVQLCVDGEVPEEA
jgi:hypothetical protein